MNIFTTKEIALMKKLDTPEKVQDFLNGLDFNFEEGGIDTIKSPLMVLRKRNAHCTEGAILGAYILSIHGHKPLILHLKTTKQDFDHVIALFKVNGFWGALSKTNHAVLRYREPVYKNIRELVMSYFHEYFLDSGQKTLRQYSRPLDLSIFESDWPFTDQNLFGIDDELDLIKHYDLAKESAIKKYRKADKIEIMAGKLEEYSKLASKQKRSIIK